MSFGKGVSCRVIERFEELGEYREAWSELAVACGKPTCRPGWLEPWWRARCAPADSDSRALRVAVVTAGDELVALLPAYLVDEAAPVPDLRLLGHWQFWGVDLLLRDDAPQGAVALIARTLGRSSPSPARLVLSAAPRRAPWLEELRGSWPGGPAHLRPGGRSESLTIRGPICPAEWRATRPRKVRQELRRRERRRSEAGFELRLAQDVEEVRADVASLARLHQSRLNHRSGWLIAGVEDVLVEAGQELLTRGDFRLWKVVREDKLVAGALFARAGDAAEALLTAFDPAWSRFGTGMASIVAGVEHELDSGCGLIDFGNGGLAYIRLLANSSLPLTNYELYPTNRGTIRARAHWAPDHARERVGSLRVRLKLRTRLNVLRRRFALER